MVTSSSRPLRVRIRIVSRVAAAAADRTFARLVGVGPRIGRRPVDQTITLDDMHLLALRRAETVDRW